LAKEDTFVACRYFGGIGLAGSSEVSKGTTGVKPRAPRLKNTVNKDAIMFSDAKKCGRCF